MVIPLPMTLADVIYFCLELYNDRCGLFLRDNIPSRLSPEINLNATNRRPQSDEESCPDVLLRSSPYTMTDRLQTAALNSGFRQAVQRL